MCTRAHMANANLVAGRRHARSHTARNADSTHRALAGGMRLCGDARTSRRCRCLAPSASCGWGFRETPARCGARVNLWVPVPVPVCSGVAPEHSDTTQHTATAAARQEAEFMLHGARLDNAVR